MTTTRQCLANFPISIFSTVMGLGGLTIAWQRAENVLNLPFRISPALLALTSLVLALLAALYCIKVFLHPAATRAEWAHPVKLNFAPTFSIGLILLSTAWLPVHPSYSQTLWIAGSSLQLLLTLYILTRWIHHPDYRIEHLNPAWFIPLVGNILVPVAGTQHAAIEISWFFFSLGLLFWPVLLTIIFYRVIFHGSLPERMLPTLFILIAPPSAGFIAYVGMTGGLDTLAYFLYNAGLVFTLLLFFQARWFVRLKFTLGWWAYSFPLAAITIASLIMFQQTGSTLYLRLAGILLGITTVVIASLTLRTAAAIRGGALCSAD